MTSGRFARNQRLLNASDFKNVFAQPVKQGDKNFTLLGRENEKNDARLGLVIPKRQIKQAVTRNRIKRLIRESFRQHQALLAGLDIIVIARVGAARLTNQAILAALDRHWLDLSKTCKKS